jgi:hypothetical protein
MGHRPAWKPGVPRRPSLLGKQRPGPLRRAGLCGSVAVAGRAPPPGLRGPQRLGCPVGESPWRARGRGRGREGRPRARSLRTDRPAGARQPLAASQVTVPRGVVHSLGVVRTSSWRGPRPLRLRLGGGL